ncbi:hypothetical protein [Streptomyces sp. NPDC058145]|uniref:hypothetical protein n=1 Tax=Streptomyces sp. NPDC058145 TaxID=3346356 RepID=UPI0036EC69D1
MSQNLTDDFYALASLIPPSRTSRYMHAQGWDLVDRREGLLEEWAEPVELDGEDDSEIYLLPINSEFRDFERRYVEFLKAVADYYAIDAHELSHRLRLGDTDVLLFRISGDRDLRDSVSLDEAGGVLSVAHRMLKASARYTASPGKELTGRMRPQAAHYIRNHVALGHTRQGSFVFPILSGPRVSEREAASFARRVVENLAIGLWRVQSIAGDRHSAVRDEFAPLVVALADSVHRLSAVSGLQAVEISFRWAPDRGTPVRIPDRGITLKPDAIRQLGMTGPRVREILAGNYDGPFVAGALGGSKVRPASSAAPALPAVEYTEVRGQVVALQIDDRRIADWGTRYSIVLRSGVDDAVFDVQIPVSERDYERAAEARGRGIAVTAMGSLIRVDSGALLEGEVLFDGEPSR